MAGSFSDFLELEILDQVFSAAAWTAPATVYLELYTAAPSDAGGGTAVTGGGYARLAVTNNATNWPAASGGAKSNGVAFEWAAATANWGTVVAMGIFDASTAGNLLAWADLTTSKAIDNGDIARFAIGEIDVTLT